VCFCCRAGHGSICSRAVTHCAELDAVIAAAKVPCPYRAFGCDRYVVYHAVADHQRGECQCAPCSLLGAASRSPSSSSTSDLSQSLLSLSPHKNTHMVRKIRKTQERRHTHTHHGEITMALPRGILSMVYERGYIFSLQPSRAIFSLTQCRIYIQV
jgi:hypothetical protein